MPTPTLTEFWQLAAASGLMSPQQMTPLVDEFQQIRGAAASGNTRTLCEWLIDRRALTRFQCDVLLLGQSGPFRYGDYVIWDRISQGRLRKIFRAVHVPTGQRVWLKFLSGPAAGDSHRQASIAATAAAWREIESEHLCAFFELLDLGSYKFLVIEDREGSSAAEHLRAQGRMAPADACSVALNVAMGLGELHRRGMVHGDVRPENVWCAQSTPHAPREGNHHAERDGYYVCLLGFPLARDPFGPSAGLDEWTADYAAPEMEEHPAPTPLTDVYALGCTLYELLTGQPPFASGPLRQSLAAKMNRHATEPIIAIDQSGPMPEGLNRVVSFMMAKNPAVRYQDMAAVGAALAPYAAPAVTASPEQRAKVSALRLFCRQRKNATGNGVPSVAASHVPTISITPLGADLGVGNAVGMGGLAFPTAGFQVADPFPLDPRAEPGAMAASRGKSGLWLVGGVLGAMVLLIAIVVALGMRQAPIDTPSPPQVVEKTPAVTPPPDDTKPAPNDESTPGPLGLPDDGNSLWVSPTQGAVPQIRYIAPGAQMLVILRPASLLAAPRGKETLDAMGPAGASLLGWIEAQTGMKPDKIDRLDIAFYEAFGSHPVTSLVAYVNQRPEESALVSAWRNSTPVDKGGHRYFQQGELCRYLPPDKKDVMVVAESAQLGDILAAGNALATLDSNLQSLVETGDVNRHVSVFFLPIYLRAARDTLYPGPLAPVREGLDWFLGPSDETQAGVASFQLSDPLFAELRLYPARSKKPKVMARDFRTRVDEWSRLMQKHLVSLSMGSYSREVLSQFPFMLQAVAQHTRHGAEGRIAVVRCYLPGEAAANLALATDLLLLETAGTVGTVSTQPKAMAKTVWERLKLPVTVSFERDSLENALKQLSTDMGVKIEILGNDLKLDGITKNQPLGLDMKNKPAEEVLGQIMLQANPDRTVKKLSDDVQKLVYVVKPGAGGGEDVILVTTRAKAAERGELPAIFKK
ncbi:MAG: protein kinase [Planctomycetes bacterium]|nr:protein kinase [Planctomycetota bacterium]